MLELESAKAGATGRYTCRVAGAGVGAGSSVLVRPDFRQPEASMRRAQKSFAQPQGHSKTNLKAGTGGPVSWSSCTRMGWR